MNLRDVYDQRMDKNNPEYTKLTPHNDCGGQIMTLDEWIELKGED